MTHIFQLNKVVLSSRPPSESRIVSAHLKCDCCIIFNVLDLKEGYVSFVWSVLTLIWPTVSSFLLNLNESFFVFFVKFSIALDLKVDKFSSIWSVLYLLCQLNTVSFPPSVSESWIVSPHLKCWMLLRAATSLPLISFKIWTGLPLNRCNMWPVKALRDCSQVLQSMGRMLQRAETRQLEKRLSLWANNQMRVLTSIG